MAESPPRADNLAGREGSIVAVDPGFREWVEDELRRIRPIRTRSMFGGLGIWADELFFALADDGALYMKGDAATRAAFEAEGSRRFHPYGPDGPAMDYWEVPAEVLEDPARLRDWVDRSLEVARRARRSRARK